MPAERSISLLRAMIPKHNAFVGVGVPLLARQSAGVALRGARLSGAHTPAAAAARFGRLSYCTLAHPKLDNVAGAEESSPVATAAAESARMGLEARADFVAPKVTFPSDDDEVANVDVEAAAGDVVAEAEKDLVVEAKKVEVPVKEKMKYSLDMPVPAKRAIKDGMGPPVDEFRICDKTRERLAKNGITSTTEVQAGTFDKLFDGADIIAKSRTGTGKTLAFALPIMERLGLARAAEGGRKPRGQGPGCIVLAPTRELAKQVAREMKYLGDGLGLSVECFYGGTSYGPQEGALRRGLDVVVGTPGRVMDHLRRGTLQLHDIQFAVLDEADEMLSMGFAEDVETVFETLPSQEKRQVILFSATVPSWVKKLASQYQKDVIQFDSVTRGSMAATTVRHCALRVPERDEARADLLADIIAVYSRPGETANGSVAKGEQSRAIVFTETKREADELATSGALEGCGAAVLHGDVSQKQREVTLAQFRKGRFQVLVATDVAARGLDISGVDVVVQYRVPNDADSYIHRSGRTGRAGKTGTAVVMYNDREQHSLRSLERLCKIKFDREAAPGPEMALEAAVDVAVGAIPLVDKRVSTHLIPRAQQILDGENPAQMLASILAIAGRRTEMPNRSVLSGEKGMRALLVRGDTEVSPGLVMRYVGEIARAAGCEERVGLIRMCQDGGAVLDVPSDAAEKIVANAAEGASAINADNMSIDFATLVPALKEQERRGGGRGGRFGGGGRGGGYRGGGGGRFGGGGGGGGYRGGGGGGGGGGYRSQGGGGGYRGGGSSYGSRDVGGGGGYSRDGGGGGYSRDGGSSRFGGGGGGRGGGSSYSRDGGGSGGRSSSRDGGGGGGRSSASRDGGGSSYSRDSYGSRGGGSSRGGGGSGGARRSAEFLSDDF